LEPITMTRVFPSLWNTANTCFVHHDSSGEDDYSDDDDVIDARDMYGYSDSD